MKGISESKSEAARRNGSKSRGPKTEKGKATSSRNAIRHGLQASSLNVVGGESEHDFRVFQKKVFDEFRPEGIVEQLLCSQLAMDGWKLERAQRAELQTTVARVRIAAELRAQRTPGSWDRLSGLVAPGPLLVTQQIIVELEKQLEALALVIPMTEQTDALPPELEDLIIREFPNDSSFTAHVRVHNNSSRRKSADDENEEYSFEIGHCEEGLEEILKKQQKLLAKRLRILQKRRRAEADGALDLIALPIDHMGGLVHRYETTIARRFQRTFSLLYQCRKSRC
jgi:hypothetical protein